MQNRTRAEQLIVRVTPKEKAHIQKKMELLGTKNFSGYARKMLIDGYVIQLDLTAFQALANEVNKIGTNINQIAKSVNANGAVYAEDMQQVKEMIDDIWRLQKSFLSDLLSKSR